MESHLPEKVVAISIQLKETYVYVDIPDILVGHQPKGRSCQFGSVVLPPPQIRCQERGKPLRTSLVPFHLDLLADLQIAPFSLLFSLTNLRI